MLAVPSACPFCGGELVVSRLFCGSCESGFEGQFRGGPFAGLTPEQIDFVEAFVRCDGKFTRLEGELGLSYPTLRARLNDVVRAMGYEPGPDEPPPPPPDRQRILDDLASGRLSADDAVKLIKGGQE